MDLTVVCRLDAPGRILRPLAPLMMALALAACASREAEPPAPPLPRAPAPAPVPTPIPPVQSIPTTPAPIPAPAPSKTSPRFAPPPHVAATWNARLGVYEADSGDLYYRERLYYRKDGGDWVCSPRPDGPWEAVPPPSVPPGLRGL